MGYFNPDLPAVVAKPFIFAGKEYAAGVEFPWRTLGRKPDGAVCELPMIELRGLWAADLLVFQALPVVSREAAPAKATGSKAAKASG